MRRIALIVAVCSRAGAPASPPAPAPTTRTPTRSSSYNAFGIVEGSEVRVAGVNAGTVTDLDINAEKRAVVTVELSGELGTLGEDTDLLLRAAVADRRVLPRLPAGGPAAARTTTTPTTRTPTSRPSQTFTRRCSRPRPEHPARALQAPPAADHQRVRHRARRQPREPQRGDPPRRPGAARAARRRWRSSADQNTIIRDLNVNSDQIIARLAERREDVVRFIEEADDTAAASAERREDLSRNFELLDDFLAELRPTLAELENLANEQTPLLTDLRAAAPRPQPPRAQPARPSTAPPRSRSTRLGEAAEVGARALSRGRDEIDAARRGGREGARHRRDARRLPPRPRRPAPRGRDRRPRRPTRARHRTAASPTRGLHRPRGAPQLRLLPGRRAQPVRPGRPPPALHASTTSRPAPAATSPPAATRRPASPACRPRTAARRPTCSRPTAASAWLGPNQPGINEDLGLPPYDPSVCPDGHRARAAAASSATRRALAAAPDAAARRRAAAMAAAAARPGAGDGADARRRRRQRRTPTRRRRPTSSGGDAAGRPASTSSSTTTSTTSLGLAGRRLGGRPAAVGGGPAAAAAAAGGRPRTSSTSCSATDEPTHDGAA